MRQLSIPADEADRLIAACREADLCIAQDGDAGAIVDLLMAAVRPVADRLARARRAQVQRDALRKRVDAALGNPVGTPRPSYNERIDAYPERGTR
jgi:hypothetical protein